LGIPTIDVRVLADRFRPGTERRHLLVLLHGSVRPLSDVLRFRVPDACLYLRRSDDDSPSRASTVSCVQSASIVRCIPVSELHYPLCLSVCAIDQCPFVTG